jgi:DNA-binding CsgD family transcriptional regulator/tetratricopeptide (TPR) repeat protein
MARLAGLARSTAAGRGGLALMEGEPGIGKTALLYAALSDAADLLPRRITGAAEEFDQRLPFATIHSWLEPLAASDRRVAEVLALIRGGGPEYPVIEAALALIEEWCSASPVALAVDDLHWADPSSILLLHRLGRVASQLPLLLAGTIRGGAGRADVDALIRSWRRHGAVQIMLGPLPEEAVTRLLVQLVGGQPGPVLRALIDGTAGNPLFINELVSALARDRRLCSGRAGVDVEPGRDGRVVPPTVGQAIGRRLEFVSAGTRELLQVAALLGSTFSVADVATVLDRPVTSLLGCVREATQGGLLAVLPDRLAFRHPLVRVALGEELPLSARQGLHLQVARALARHASPDRVAEHLLAAGPAAAALLPWLAEHADDLAVRAPALAAELLGGMLDAQVPLPGETGHRLCAGLATALLRVGQPAQAERVARSALAGTAGLRAPPGRRTEAALRWTLVSACISQGRADRALAEIGIALATGRLTRGEQARFGAQDARCRIALGKPGMAAEAWQDSVSAAQASGDVEALAHVMAAAAAACLWDGRVEKALGYAGASISATEALGPRVGAQLAPHFYRGICLTELDCGAEAERAFEGALRVAERGIGTDYLGWCYYCLARIRFYQGRWEETLAGVRAGLDLPDLLNIGRHLRSLAWLIAIHRRDRAAAVGLLPDLQAPPPPTLHRDHSAHTPELALAQAAHAEGRTGEAAAILAATWNVDDDRDQVRFMRHHLVPTMAALSLSAGDQAAARRIADSIGRYAAQRPVPALHRSARHARALAGQDAAALADVGDDYDGAGWALPAAQAREQAAPLLAAAGLAREARTALLAAVAVYESAEASWDLARAETQLRALGVRRGIRGPRCRPKIGWDALTDAEKTVAGLVAEGLSNPAIAARLYLSRRTVQFHVSNILGKLGAASRVELATMVIRHDTAGG